MDEGSGRRKLIIFGTDLSEIPCFRNSLLYGISGGLGTGMLHFLFTSKAGRATNVGYASFVGITLTYWYVCRYNYKRKIVEIQKMKEYLQKRVLIEGTEMEKLYEADGVEVDPQNVADV